MNDTFLFIKNAAPIRVKLNSCHVLGVSNTSGSVEQHIYEIDSLNTTQGVTIVITNAQFAM